MPLSDFAVSTIKRIGMFASGEMRNHAKSSVRHGSGLSLPKAEFLWSNFDVNPADIILGHRTSFIFSAHTPVSIWFRWLVSSPVI